MLLTLSFMAQWGWEDGSMEMKKYRVTIVVYVHARHPEEADERAMEKLMRSRWASWDTEEVLENA